MNILFYSYLCFCVDSFQKNDVVFLSIQVNSFILGFIQDGCSFATYPVAFSEMLFSLKDLFINLIFISRLCEEELFFVCNIRGRCCHLNVCCLHILPDFETDLVRDFQFQSGEKVSCCVKRASDKWCFEIELQHIIPFVPQGRWDRFRLKNTGDWFVVRYSNRRF